MRLQEIIKLDIVKAYSIFLSSVLIRYYMPPPFANVYFYFLLILFAYSTKNSFWFAIFFMLIEAPGGLFSAGGGFGLPKVFYLGSTLDYPEMFLIVSTVKALFLKKTSTCLLFVKLILTMAFYKAINILLNSAFHETSLHSLIKGGLQIAPYAFLFVIPRLFGTFEAYVQFFRILAPFVIIVVFTQLIEVVEFKPAAYFFGDRYYRGEGVDLYGEEISEYIKTRVRAPIYSYYLLFTVFISSLFLVSSKKIRTYTKTKRSYILTFVIGVLLSIIISGTRGWIISFFTIIVLFVLLSKTRLKSTIQFMIIFVVIAGIILYSSPTIRQYVLVSYDRLSTVSLILEGDLTAGGTLKRLDIRGPQVLNKAKESLIIGFGISDDYFAHEDRHVGHHNLLLNSGIVGTFLFFLFLFFYNTALFRAYKNASSENTYKYGVLVFAIASIGLMIIHSSSRMMYSYLINVPWGIMICYLYSFSCIVYKRLYVYEKLTKNN